VVVEATKDIPIFRESDEWRSYWDQAVLVAALINAFAIPLVISFSPTWSEKLLYTLIDTLTNLLFIADIVVVSNTAFFDKNSEEETSRREIMIRYLKGSFLVDFVSSIPWDYVFKDFAGVKVLNALKIIRILRIQKLISRMKAPEDQKAVSLLNLISAALSNSATRVHADADHPPVHVPVVQHDSN
jgi:hypothetical protein